VVSRSASLEETTVRFRSLLVCCAVLAFASLLQNEASAARRVRSNQSATPTTILPSREEIAAVPVPEQGRVLAYPGDVVRYGLTVHPGARTVRRVLGR
jgi:hypothetical protein